MATEPAPGQWALYARESGIAEPPQFSIRRPLDHWFIDDDTGERTPMVVPDGGGAAVPAPDAAPGDSFEEVLADADFLHDCTDAKHTNMGVGAPQLDPDGWDIVCAAIRD